MATDTNNSFVEKFSEVLAELGYLKKADVVGLAKNFRDQDDDRSFEEFLVDEGVVSRQNIMKALGVYYGVGAVDLAGAMLDHHLVVMFPKDVLLRYMFVPYQQDENILIVAAAEPDNPDLPDIIGEYVSYDVTFVAAYFRDIRNAIEEFHDKPVTEDLNDDDLRQEQEYVLQMEHMGSHAQTAEDIEDATLDMELRKPELARTQKARNDSEGSERE